MLIKGEIVAGDSAKFAKYLQANHPFVERVSLWSSGGLVDEAMRIGRLVRKTMLVTYAPDSYEWTPDSGELYAFMPNSSGSSLVCNSEDCHCASARVLIWAAGATRSGNRLGLHRPSLRSTSFANVPPDQASGLYRSLLADIDRYLTAMEVPRGVIEAMIDTSSSDIQWIDPKIYEKSGIAPSIAEWIYASCGGNSVDRFWKKLNRSIKQDAKLLTKSEIKAEFDSESRILSCEDKKFANARDAIDDKMLTESIFEILSAKTTPTTPN